MTRAGRGWGKVAVGVAVAITVGAGAPVLALAAGPKRAVNREKESPVGAWTTVAEFPVGKGPGQLAFALSDAEPRGPDSFAVDRQGRIYVLDGVDHSIEVWDAGRKRTIDLPEANDPLDLAVAEDGAIYVLDTGRVAPLVLKLTPNGSVLETRTVMANVESITGLTVDRSGDVLLRVGSTRQLSLAASEIGNATVTAGQTPPGGQEPLSLERVRQGVRLSSASRSVTVDFQGQFGAVVPLGEDASGSLHVEALDMVNGPRATGELTLRRYNEVGKRTGVVALGPVDWGYVPKTHFTRLGADGQVYALIPGATKVQVMRATYGTKYQSKFTALQREARRELQESAESATPIRASSVSEADASQRAGDIIYWIWDYTPANRTPRTDSLQPPDYLEDAPYFWQYGIPYAWGGFDGLNTSSTPGAWSNFADAMNKGKYAGNVLTAGYYKPATAGLDCSGFVSTVWGLREKVGTWHITYDRRLTAVIDRAHLLPMDAAVNAGHVVLKQAEDPGGLITAESTTTNDDKTQYFYRSWSYLWAAGYSYRRYVNMTH